jgi:lipopolysaccharide exporter
MEDSLTTTFITGAERAGSSFFIRNVATLVSGNILAQLIGVVTVPLVSRIYSQEAFGEYSIFVSTGSIAACLSSLGLTSAIMIPKDDRKGEAVVCTGFLTQLLVATVFLTLALIFRPHLTVFATRIPYGGACLLLYAYLLLTNLSALLSTYANRQKKYRVLFWNSLIGSLATLFITLPLGLLGWGSLGFITAQILGLLVANTQMIVRSNPFRQVPRLRQVLGIYREFREFIAFQFPSNLISNFSVQLPNQMFAANFGTVALGGYAMCQRLMGYPIRFIGAPVGTVFFRTAAQYRHEGKDLGRFTFAMISRIMLIGYLPVVLLMVYGDRLFMIILGKQWREAGLFASVLAVQYLLIFCNQCTSCCRVVIDRQRANLLMSVLQLVTTTVPIGIGIVCFKTLMATIVCFAVGNTLFQALDICVNFYCIKSHLSRFCVFLSMYGAALLVPFGLRQLL